MIATNVTLSGESINEIETAMNLDLMCVKEWFQANKLSLNVAKTEFLLIGSRYNLKNIDKQPSNNIDN